jgi:hypothetical protein
MLLDCAQLFDNKRECQKDQTRDDSRDAKNGIISLHGLDNGKNR